MKSCSKLVISSLFYFFCILKSTFGDTCNPVSCPRGMNISAVSGSPVDLSVQYPFHITDLQSKSCGMPGFDLYCDKSFGTLLQLPDNVVLRVDAILYSSDDIYLSDPYNCLPHILMSLNLTKTPFYLGEIAKRFWLYNCSGEVNHTVYDQIDCLSGSNYTVISSGYDAIENADALDCTLVKVLNVPVSSNYSIDLSSISRIKLAWNGSLLPQAPQKVVDNAHNSRTVKFVLTFMGMMIVVLCVLFCGFHYLINRNEQVTTTTINNNDTMSNNSYDDVAGLDQVTINSYPTVVVGESGHLIIQNDNTCSICLDDYQSQQTLKMLPQCLHRFHEDCINQWLRSKSICPICRASPPRHS